jgi:cold shock protein
MRETSTIRKYFDSRGFGFILREGTPDLFFHVKDVRGINAGQTIQEGALVEFEVTQTDRGLRAVDVVLL